MLRVRLLVGSVLVAAALALILVDPAPWYPGFLFLIEALALAACFELLRLLGPRRPAAWLCYLGVALVLAAPWLARWRGESWAWIAWVLAGFVLSVFLDEMARFREPGESVTRMALAVWLVGYLGLLPCFLALIRFLPGEPEYSTMALLLTIFVPKSGDIGAYFTGRFLGRHKMSPVLSPKKTWEGAAGGMALAVLVTVAVDLLGPVRVLGAWWAQVGFGLSVGVAGLLGDLAESLIKRDCRQKDASQAVPGFGGVLDVVDALLFAAPVAYIWLSLTAARD
jgi:phosphatidate cytidylyltransferase